MSCIVCCLFFFFKQKTAYEMRISDWSSDVCSSDLRIAKPRPREFRERVCPPPASEEDQPDADHDAGSRDRKSVVSGKSVSVRVDLGGRRIIKKKNITQTA